MNDEQTQNLAKHTANIIDMIFDETFGKVRITQQVQESLLPEVCPESYRRCENGHEITWDNYRGE